MTVKARIRSIKPEMWHDEKIGALSRDARLLFIGLITMADDEGRLRALPAVILGHCFPYDRDAAKRLGTWMDELACQGLIQGYSDHGASYVAITNWSRHQRVNRPSPSLIPAPHAHDALTERSVNGSRSKS